jgi:hypothetical protein
MDNPYEFKYEESERKLPKIIKLLEKHYPKYIFNPAKKTGDRADKELSCDMTVLTPNEKRESWAIKIREKEFQEKFGDVTVEYKNAAGTQFENLGDWANFKGGSVAIYVYGWSNGETRILIIDIKKMMAIPENEWKQKIFQNKTWGRANFKAISINALKKHNAILKKIDTEKIQQNIMDYLGDRL